MADSQSLSGSSAGRLPVTPPADGAIPRAPPSQRRWLPFADPSRRRRIAKVGGWIGAVAVVVAVLAIAGVDVGGWFGDAWRAVTDVGVGYVLAGWTLVSMQIALTALGWFFILRAGFPKAAFGYGQVLAAYATGVAINGFLPAHVGTLVMLLMYAAIVRGATFAGLVGAMAAQKLVFVGVSALSYVYLFASVPRTYGELALPQDRPVLIGFVVLAVVALVAVLIRLFWSRLKEQWEKAKGGAAILAQPRRYLRCVVLPSLAAWVAGLGVIAVFLTAYGIGSSFNTVMWISGGNSLAAGVAVTPGGAGINQATNAVALVHETDAATANAYSFGQHLSVTAWKVVFALVLVIWAFGWSGGKALIEESFAGAKVKAGEQKAQRRRRRAARRRARA